MIDYIGYTIFPWALLNLVCSLIGGMLLRDFDRTALGALLGILLGPAGLIIVVFICQWEHAKDG